MRTLFLMAWANVKSKKFQTLALVAVFIAVSILFFLSIRLFGSVGSYGELYIESKTSQSLIYSNNEEAKDIAVEFLENHEEISNVNVQINFDSVIEANIIQEGDSFVIPDTFFTEYTTGEYDQIKIIDGKSANELSFNEVIFSYGKSQLNNVTVGDELVVSTEDGQRTMIIAGIGVDLTFNFDTIELNRFWTSRETIESLETGEREYSIGISYQNYSKESEEKILDQLNVALGDKAGDSLILAHSLILDANSFFQVIMGAIFTLIGVILVVVGLFIIRSIIYNNILTESKKIATLKSTGFSSNNIISIYLMEYGVIGFISIIIGFFGSYALGDIVLGDLTELSNLFGTSNGIDIIQTIPLVIIVLVVIELTVYLVAKGVSKVKPAVALSRGEQVHETKQVVSLTKYRKTPISLVLAIKDMVYNKRMIITLTFFIIAFAFTIVSLSSASYSLTSQKDDISLWTGYDVDARIVSETPLDLESHQEIISRLEASKYVEGTVTRFIDLNSQIYDDEQDKYLTSISELFVTENKEAIHFNVMDGRVPENSNEVMLGHNMLTTLDKELGDYVTVLSLGEETELLIVGEYQSFTNQGMSFRVFYDTLPEEILNNSTIQINFVSDVDELILRDVIKTMFRFDNFTLTFEEPNASMASMIDILSVVTTGVIGIFAVICLVVLLNLNLTNVNKERFNYGIYKSIGMDNQSIVNIYLFKNTLINIVGVLIGGIFGIICLPIIMNSMTGSLGINQFPSRINFLSIIITLCIVFGVTFVNSLVIKHNISSITPKELLIE